MNIAEFILMVPLMALTVLGVALIASGLVRRSEPSPPHCHGCGFDLSGLPDLYTRPSRCPECGRELPGAITHRREFRRWNRVRLGALLLLPVLSVSLVQQYASLRGNQHSFTPTWILAQRVSRDYGDRHAMAELVRRIESGSADRERIGRLIEEGLRWQASVLQAQELIIVMPSESGQAHSQPVERILMKGSHWTSLLEAAVINGYTTPEQGRRFISNGITVEVFLDDHAIDVQVISTLGPSLTAMVDVGTGAVFRATASGTAAVTPPSASGTASSTVQGAGQAWWWRYELPEGSGRASVTWNVDAQQAMLLLGESGGRASGEVHVDYELMQQKRGLIRSWRPLE